MYLFKRITNNRYLISIWIDSGSLICWVNAEGNQSKETVCILPVHWIVAETAGEGVESPALLGVMKYPDVYICKIRDVGSRDSFEIDGPTHQGLNL